MPPAELPKAYDPALVEESIYRFWLDKGYFTPRIDLARKPFVIIQPPPNMTGDLHYGHALTAALEDIMVRWHRMLGEPALFLPGVDHAGIATQVVVERQLAAKGLDRHTLGREKFLEKVWEWVGQCRGKVRMQHERLGVSCDWTRERFTLDEGPSRAVRAAFVRLYDKGLIYRGERIVNWCPRCRTALSDLEVEHEEADGRLYHINYAIAGRPGAVTVATTRPETLLGDTAVAVHPDDPRYRKVVGSQVVLPVLGRQIPVIADEAVDQAFGTGAVKVTPSHDPADFEIGNRHGLPRVNVLNADGTMNENAGPYAGQDRFACRQALVERLRQEGLLVKVEMHRHAVGHCQRCRSILEPWVSKQWFVKVGPLARPALDAVLKGDIRILPEQFSRDYVHWMENLRDWCISRQLWWGHPIPVWYCDCGETIAAVEAPSRCPRCGSKGLKQDPDVLDTWFSSGLWPHSTLGWPEDTEDFRYYYPTSVMETAYDILFFWVARMIMMGIEDTGRIPFHTVYLHGLVRDEKGEKMSKVKGNVLDPLDAVERYGADALRFALTVNSAPGGDQRINAEKLEWGRNFANKLWNAARFVMQNVPAGYGNVRRRILADHMRPEDRPLEDRWILSRLKDVTEKVDRLMRDFQFGEAERQVYEFVWVEYCDWYIELAKVRLAAARRGEMAKDPLPYLVYALETSLELLHPFMPFITERLWQGLAAASLVEDAGAGALIVSVYPQSIIYPQDPEAEAQLGAIIEVVRGIRNARAQHGVEAARWIEARIYAASPGVFQAFLPALEVMARVRPLQVHGRAEARPVDKAVTLVLSEADVVLPLAGMIDQDAQRTQIEKELAACTAEMERLDLRLKDAAFVERAPAAVVGKERERRAKAQDRLDRLRERLDELS